MNTHEQDPSCVCVQTLLFLIFVDGISSSTYNSPEEIACWRGLRQVCVCGACVGRLAATCAWSKIEDIYSDTP